MKKSLVRALACLLVAFAGTAFAQQWPQKPVRIIVPYAPGGNTDSIARLTVERLYPQFAGRLEGMGVDPVQHTPAEFAEEIRREMILWRDVIQAAGIKPE